MKRVTPLGSSISAEMLTRSAASRSQMRASAPGEFCNRSVSSVRIIGRLEVKGRSSRPHRRIGLEAELVENRPDPRDVDLVVPQIIVDVDPAVVEVRRDVFPEPEFAA